MKTKILRVSIALILALSLSLVMAVPVGAQTTYYVATTGSDTTGDGSSGNPWATIGYAISQASASDTIIAADGTYTEDLTINKGLTFQGASSSTTIINGKHTITASTVSMSDLQLAPAGGVAVTIDSSSAALSSFSFTSCIFDLSTSGGVGVWIGGSTPNAVSAVVISNNTFNGPTNMASNPFRIGGWYGTTYSCQVTNLDFENNTVNKGSIPVYLNAADITDVLINSNTFVDTDGGIYVWSNSGDTPTGVLSQFVFTNNDMSASNTYGVGIFGWTGSLPLNSSPYTDANFGSGNAINYNDFSGITSNYGLDGVTIYGTFTSYELDATDNYWGSAVGPTHSTNVAFNASTGRGVDVSDDVDFVPWYDTDMTGSSFAPVTVGTSTTYHASIQAGIDAASPGDVITCATGTFTEDLAIPTGKDNLELKPATGAVVTIKGVSTFPGPFPGGIDNIDILASGVKIHGFTIESPNAASGEYASGMLIGASNVEIYDNAFKTHTQATGQYSVVIQTYRKVLPGFETVDLSGLNIHNNTFDDLGDGAVGYDGIFVNIDTGTGTATIADNVFTGSLFRAISAERSNMVISGNSIITDLPPWTSGFAGGYQGMFIGCFAVDTVYPAQSDVSVTGNTVKGATSSEGFVQGIRIGHTSQTSLTNITVSRNTVQDCDEGITVRADASGVAVNYNSITGNTVGVENDDTGVELDAQYNWYGDVAGPTIGTNPYDGPTTGDSVSADVDYLPWMIHDTLVSGWNIWSTPIAPSAGQVLFGEPAASKTNTVTEALDLWTADSTKVTAAYCFDSSSQLWATPGTLTPLQPVYLHLSAAATIDVCISDGNYAPPARTMHVGWNLVGPAELENMDVDDALISAYWGTGETSLIGYNYVISPSIHQTATWTFIRDETPTAEDFIPTEGYWVYMVNQGTLGGFTYTPITPLP